MTVIQDIAGWSSDIVSFSSTAISRAENAFFDTIGCIVAGANDPATRAVAEAFRSPVIAESCSVATGGRASPSVAALINGVAAHALDFDDNFHGATTHASAVLVPALLATAQSCGRSGRELIEAYIVGLEAQARIGCGVNPSHYTAGWHATSTVGCIGTAAGVARLMGLDREKMANAMSIAVSMSAGVKGQFGTPVKPLHAGLAARNAIDAANLSASGMFGRLDILESRQGFLALYGGEYPRGWADAGRTVASELAVETIGLTTKRHPCCGATHRTIDAVLDLKHINSFGPDDVASVRVKVTQAHARNLAYSQPTDEMQARFSMPYAVSLALLRDGLRLSDFTQATVGRSEVRRLLSLTTISTYDEVTERSAKGRLPHHIVVDLKDGRRFEDVRQSAKGEACTPFSEAELEQKFIDCCHFGKLSAAEGLSLLASTRALGKRSALDLTEMMLR